ncbi:hypothetical protein M0804_014322 [Polistes exclamans]|nr:hypothetical protein M0804_014322 [Polistes exclamans]
MLLSSMPAEYENFTIAIESRDELPDLESLKVKLIEEEARRGEVYTVSGETSYDNALVTKNKQNNYTKHKQGESVKNKERRFRFSGNCYICKKYGHRASDCRYKNANTSQKQNDALAATVLKNGSRKPNVWYLDSGATTHVSNEKDKFVNLDEHRTKIYTFTEESVNSTGRGTIEIKVNIGKEENPVKLKDVMLATSFKSNLLSVS